MQVIVDIALVSACLAVICSLLAAVRWGYKAFKKFDDVITDTAINTRMINELQINQNNCSMRHFDIEKFEEIVEGLQQSSEEYRKNMIKDFEAIKEMKRSQKVELQAIMTLYKHVRDGNHVDEIQSSFDKLIDELVGLERI